MSVGQTVATLTKHDDDKTRRLEQTVLDLNTTLQEKDQQIRVLQESIQGLEKTNTQLKDEQESLKTVNQLQLEDMNRFNSDLQQQVSSFVPLKIFLCLKRLSMLSVA